MISYSQTTKRKCAKQPNGNAPNNQTKMCQTTKFVNKSFSISDSFECDAVVHLRNGSYGLVEVKLGGSRSLKRVQQI